LYLNDTLLQISVHLSLSFDPLKHAISSVLGLLVSVFFCLSTDSNRLAVSAVVPRRLRVRRYHLKIPVNPVDEVYALLVPVCLLAVLGEGVVRQLFVLFVVSLLFEGSSLHISNYIIQTVTSITIPPTARSRVYLW
jgi:hypothetical protein